MNLTECKTLANWGKNEDLSDKPSPKKEEKEEVSEEVLIQMKSSLIEASSKLLNEANALYESCSVKELHDSIINIGLVCKSLNSIDFNKRKKCVTKSEE